MPLGWLGQLINRALIADKLERIFDTRHAYLQNKFGMKT
jgi:hypothetical protein